LLVLPMALAVGSISPVVSFVLLAAGRFKAGSALPYIVTRVIGGFGGGGHVLSCIKRRNPVGNTFTSTSNPRRRFLDQRCVHHGR
jgi:glycerol uptake facilitator-like aquaporin